MYVSFCECLEKNVRIFKKKDRFLFYNQGFFFSSQTGIAGCMKKITMLTYDREKAGLLYCHLASASFLAKKLKKNGKNRMEFKEDNRFNKTEIEIKVSQGTERKSAVKEFKYRVSIYNKLIC